MTAAAQKHDHHSRVDVWTPWGRLAVETATPIAYPTELGGDYGSACFSSFVPAFDFVPKATRSLRYVNERSEGVTHELGTISQDLGFFSQGQGGRSDV